MKKFKLSIEIEADTETEAYEILQAQMIAEDIKIDDLDIREV